jgi:NarL family two-component system response regulator LiaR
MDPITTMLVDDHEIVRQGLRRILEADQQMRVVGEAANGLEALERAAALRPAVVLMDIKMPVMGGLEATRRLKADHPTISVIMLTSYADNALLADALSFGASSYLIKDASPQLILHTIKAVAAGARPADAAHRPPGIRTSVTDAVRHAGLVEPLSERERTVLQCVAAGQTNKEIGNALGYAEVTVKKYVQTILAKLYASDRTEAATTALRLGLIKSDGLRSRAV